MARLSVAYLALFLCIIGSSIGAKLPKVLINPEPTLEYLGQYNTKLYFTDITVSQTAVQSKAYCEVNNMTAAQFENREELQGVISFLSLSTRYWTSAISTMGFQWEAQGEEIHDSLFVNVGSGTVPSSCVYVTWEELWSGPCDEVQVGYDYFPLCQAPIQN